MPRVYLVCLNVHVIIDINRLGACMMQVCQYFLSMWRVVHSVTYSEVFSFGRRQHVFRMPSPPFKSFSLKQYSRRLSGHNLPRALQVISKFVARNLPDPGIGGAIV